MMTLSPLCTDAQLERYMSVYGISTWADHDQSGANDDGVVDDCKDYATGFIIGRLVQRYSAAIIATALIIPEIACVIALRTLCTRRGNPPPASLEMRYQELVAKDGELDQIAKGTVLLVDANGVPLRSTILNAPSHANLLVDRRMAERRIRVVDGSSNMRSTKLRRDVDLYMEGDR